MSMNPQRTHIDHPVKHEREGKERFETHSLTTQERDRLGVAIYYRPYSVDHKAVLKGRRYYWKFKRAFDIACALLALIVLSPVMLLTMLAIFIEDPHSSPIFKQERVGRGGRVFMFYKLRCMEAVRRLHSVSVCCAANICARSTIFSRFFGFRYSGGGVGYFLAA